MNCQNNFQIPGNRCSCSMTNGSCIGLPGPTGPTGATGPQGMMGAQGVPGAPGPQGVQGLQGEPGPVGPQGLQGLQGVPGPMGPVGPQGLQGIQGVPGPAGAQGMQGENGVAGPTGPAGAQGIQGATGPTGPTGPAGSQGTQGATGPTGPTGATGPAGTSGAFIIPYTTGYTAIATPTTNASGQSVRIAVTGFGESGLNIALNAPNGNAFTPTLADDWYMFTLPNDIVITKIIASVVNGITINLSSAGNLVPYIVIATAPANTKNYTFVAETYFETAPFLGGQSHPTHGTIVSGESADINVSLTKGTQVMICMGLKMPSAPFLALAPIMGFNGGLVVELA